MIQHARQSLVDKNGPTPRYHVLSRQAAALQNGYAHRLDVVWRRGTEGYRDSSVQLCRHQRANHHSAAGYVIDRGGADHSGDTLYLLLHPLVKIDELHVC